MSDRNNTVLLELAAEQIDYWSGTLHAKQIEWALEINDMDLLSVYVKKARDKMFELEYNPPKLPDEVGDTF